MDLRVTIISPTTAYLPHTYRILSHTYRIVTACPPHTYRILSAYLPHFYRILTAYFPHTSRILPHTSPACFAHPVMPHQAPAYPILAHATSCYCRVPHTPSPVTPPRRARPLPCPAPPLPRRPGKACHRRLVRINRSPVMRRHLVIRRHHLVMWRHLVRPG